MVSHSHSHTMFLWTLADVNGVYALYPVHHRLYYWLNECFGSEAWACVQFNSGCKVTDQWMNENRVITQVSRSLTVSYDGCNATLLAEHCDSVMSVMACCCYTWNSHNSALNSGSCMVTSGTVAQPMLSWLWLYAELTDSPWCSLVNGQWLM